MTVMRAMSRPIGLTNIQPEEAPARKIVRRDANTMNRHARISDGLTRTVLRDTSPLARLPAVPPGALVLDPRPVKYEP